MISVETYVPSFEFVMGPCTADGLANVLVEHTKAFDDDEVIDDTDLEPSVDGTATAIERFMAGVDAILTAVAQQLPAHLIFCCFLVRQIWKCKRQKKCVIQIFGASPIGSHRKLQQNHDHNCFFFLSD